MFRKEPELIRSWEEKDSSFYVPIQKRIILAAADMLKKGGTMVYSTCTFSVSENEEVIEHLLKQRSDLKVLSIPRTDGFVSGLSENTKGCVRLYPHRIKGEGHFVALLQKEGNTEDRDLVSYIDTSIVEPFFDHIDPSFFKRKIVQRKEKLYLEPENGMDLSGLRVLRSGLYLGEYRRERFEPSQALAYALKKEQFDTVLDLKVDDPRVLKYLKCETLSVNEAVTDGWILVCVEGQPLGFGILKNRQLKNRLPANYRYQ